MGIAAEPPRVLQSRDLAQLPQMRVIMRRFPVEKIMNARIQDFEPPDQTDLKLGPQFARQAGLLVKRVRGSTLILRIHRSLVAPRDEESYAKFPRSQLIFGKKC